MAGPVHAPLLEVNAFKVLQAMEGKWGGVYPLKSAISAEFDYGCKIPPGNWTNTIVFVSYFLGCSLEEKSRQWQSTGVVALIANSLDLAPSDIVANYWDKTTPAVIPMLLLGNRNVYSTSSDAIVLEVERLLNQGENVTVRLDYPDRQVFSWSLRAS